MSILDAYRACLIELNKVLAPSLLLDDFNYLFNKAILQYANKKYNLFEINQQSTDDLRVLTKSVKITNLQAHDIADVFGTSYDCPLPIDYMHILNCICEFKDLNPRCPGCNTLRIGANKLTTNLWSKVITNYYMRPSVKLPYYYIINIDDPVSNVNYTRDETKQKEIRYGNSQIPMMLIKCGNRRDKYELQAVYIDYLRSPKYVKLTQEEIDDKEDHSMILEFNDYVIYEIINDIITLIMENNINPRIQTYNTVNTTIAPPLAQDNKR